MGMRSRLRRKLRNRYTGVAQRYYDQRRAGLVKRHGEDRVAEWESVVAEHLASRTGHLPPLEAVLLLSDVFRAGQWHENQRHARAQAQGDAVIPVVGVNLGDYTVELPTITEPGHYTVTYAIEGPGRLRVTSVERKSS